MIDSQLPSRKTKKFDEFWLFYLTEHSDVKNRRLHFVGTGLSLLFVLGSAVLKNVWLLATAVLMGYALAWFGHFFVEKNRPATFRSPIFSLFADYRMFFLFLCGRLDTEIKRAQTAQIAQTAQTSQTSQTRSK